jgi:hypothetical protein
MSEKIMDLVTPIAVSSEEMTYSNKVYLSPEGSIPRNKKYIVLKGYILPFALSETIPKGKIGLNKKFREFLVLSLIDQIYIQAYDQKSIDQPATSITIKIEMLLPPSQRVEIDDKELSK